MGDPEVVAAIMAGDPAGLAEAYDKYAVPLYTYCRSLLREPADAADAVHDTFLIAAAKLRGLRDPGRLRGWLYSVARNECRRRLRAGAVLSALEEAVDMPSQTCDVGTAAERAELHQLIRAAIAGLNPGERDVIELSLGSGLEGDELADALGVSRNHAHALLSRARSQLERSLGALLVARHGRAACAELDAMLDGWDRQLTVLMRKRISRHIERCAVCGERKRREMTPAMFAGALPLVALPLGAQHALTLSPGFRTQVLRAVADRSPAGMAHRLAVANRAGPFGPSGFPKPISPPGTAPWQRVLHHPHALIGGTATSVAAAAAITVGVVAGPHHGPPTAAAGRSTKTATTISSSARGGPPGARHPAGPAPGTPGGTVAPEAFRSAGGSRTPADRPSATTSPASEGTLEVSTGRLDLVSLNGTATATFTLTARGGPVARYSITVGSALAGGVVVSPATGSIAAGASVTITVTATRPIALDGQLIVNPGGRTITVALSLGL